MTTFTRNVSIKSVIAGLTAVLATSAALPAMAQVGGYNGYAHSASGTTSQMRVDLNHTAILNLPYPASAVVVGNPEVADIAVHSTSTLLLLGRSYGTTNVLAMDAAGRVIANTTITVGAMDAPGRVQVFDGTTRRTFACSPNCNPAPELGDEPEFAAQNRPAAPELNNSFASAGALSSAVPGAGVPAGGFSADSFASPEFAFGGRGGGAGSVSAEYGSPIVSGAPQSAPRFPGN